MRAKRWWNKRFYHRRLCTSRWWCWRPQRQRLWPYWSTRSLNYGTACRVHAFEEVAA